MQSTKAPVLGRGVGRVLHVGAWSCGGFFVILWFFPLSHGKGNDPRRDALSKLMEAVVIAARSTLKINVLGISQKYYLSKAYSEKEKHFPANRN